MAGRAVVALLYLPSETGRALGEYLERRGYETKFANETWKAESLLRTGGLGVAVVGPGEESLEFLRRYGTPDGPLFLMLTNGPEVFDKVLALELGAADVVELSAPPRELAARIGGLLLRKGLSARELLMLERSTVDLKAALVMHRSGREEQLSPGQVALLRLFISRPRTVLTRDDIIAAAPAEAADAFDRSIDSRIVRLRRKLATESIVTVRGAGYRFDPPAEPTA